MAVMRRRNWPAKAARFAVKTAMAYKRYRSYVNTKNKRTRSNVNYITQQHDAQSVYRRRPMPKYKKRKWVSFVKKVQAVVDNKHGTKTLVFNAARSVVNAVNLQNFGSCYLYGKNGIPPLAANEIGFDDLFRVFTAVGGSATSKLHFKSAVLDCTFTNTSTSAVIELDIYKVYFRGETNQSSVTLAVANAEGDTPVISASAPYSPLGMLNRGCTPFEFPQLIRSTGMKIVSKNKHFVAPGNAVSYQMRDPRNRQLLAREANLDGPGFIQPGWTQGFFYIFKPVAGFTGETVTLAVGATRKYSFVDIVSSVVQDNVANI